MWGAEASFLSAPYFPGEGIGWQWLGGFRYLNYEEDFRHTGTFNNGGQALTTTTRVASNTVNNMFGPEVGGRLSVKHRKFTLSATPRIAFALNNVDSETSFNDAITAAQKETEFTPIVQVDFRGEFHVTPNMSLFAGYDLLWMYRVTRPFDNIVYDSTPGAAGSFTTNITQEIDFESFYARGFSVGAVFRY